MGAELAGERAGEHAGHSSGLVALQRSDLGDLGKLL